MSQNESIEDFVAIAHSIGKTSTSIVSIDRDQQDAEMSKIVIQYQTDVLQKFHVP